MVPDSGSDIQPADNGDTDKVMSNSEPELDPNLTTVELEEVRKLQDLVRQLEVQNQTLHNRSRKQVLGGTNNSNLKAGSNINNLHKVMDTSPGAEEAGNLELSPPADSSGSEDMSPLPDTSRVEEQDGFLSLPCSSGSKQTMGWFVTSNCDSGMLGASEASKDQSALDEVDVLDLELCAKAEDEDSWLYVSPKKEVVIEHGPESPLKWCRKVLDHPSPATEVACRTLINRLDQSSRWKNVYSSPSQTSEAGVSASSSAGYLKSTNKTLLTSGSSGYMGVYSALSSQSSVDSELSSDESISMGYKLQDLTDVQIMARLQEESLRQDYASTSASRRSSSASLQSLRRGTYSDQEFDSYSQEDEEDECCSLPQHLQRYSPSPHSSPRCLSPSTLAEYNRLSAPRPRLSRCSLAGGGAKSEEELRHSMPNLTPRTSLRSLEAVRNSRSMEANLQSSGNRTSCLPHSPKGASSSRMRSDGQSPLYLRAPMKALSPVGSMSALRQHAKGPPSAQVGHTEAMRRVQSPGSKNGVGYSGCRTAVVTRQTPGRGMTPASPSSRTRLPQTPRSRSLGMTKPSGHLTDESWKDGCY